MSHRHWRSQMWQTHDSKYAFLEAGLVTMTNHVNLDYQQVVEITQKPDVAEMRMMTKIKHKTLLRKRRRSFFPETWLWQCFNVRYLFTMVIS